MGYDRRWKKLEKKEIAAKGEWAEAPALEVKEGWGCRIGVLVVIRRKLLADPYDI